MSGWLKKISRVHHDNNTTIRMKKIIQYSGNTVNINFKKMVNLTEVRRTFHRRRFKLAPSSLLKQFVKKKNRWKWICVNQRFLNFSINGIHFLMLIFIVESLFFLNSMILMRHSINRLVGTKTTINSNNIILFENKITGIILKISKYQVNSHSEFRDYIGTWYILVYPYWRYLISL